MAKLERVLATLRGRLESGVYPLGGLLPPERTLAVELGVSRPTLRKALDQLAREDRVVRRQGIGTQAGPENGDPREDRESWKIIAFLVPDITNRFFSEVAEAVECAALRRGYQIILCNSRHQPRIEETHIRQLAKRRVDGVILAHDPYLPFPESLRLLNESRIPVVALFSSPTQTMSDSVVLDERKGVAQVMRYLSSLGHRRIGFCRPVPGSTPHPRETAYCQFLKENRIDFVAEWVLPYDEDETGYRGRLEALLGAAAPPTALFTGNDRVALIVLKHLAAMGVSVPGGISLVGFDNMRFTEHLPVPLTTVDQPKQEMGRRAAEMLFERIELGGLFQPRREVFEPHLIIRDSCTVASAQRRPWHREG